ncbi:MAG: glycosyltransferase family 39 protein [Microgenomates group bacterium]
MGYKNSWWLLLILGVALVVRLYQLADVPYGLHVDEVKAGWNAYLILQTGGDDKGNYLPMYYDSFGDFRPTGLIYLIIPSLVLFGKTVLAVRLPFAIVGGLSVVTLYLLVYQLSSKKRLAMISALMLALNPWHIVASRSTSESIVAVFGTLWALYFLIKLIKVDLTKYAVGCYLSLVVTFFFYHNIRVLGIVFVVVVVLFNRLVLTSRMGWRQIYLVLAILMTTGLMFINPSARGRMGQVSLKSDFQVLYEVTKMPTEEGPNEVLRARIFHNRWAAYLRRFAEEYKEYFGTDFLLGNSAKPIRYTVPYVGLLTYIEFVLVVIGLFGVGQRRELLLIVALLALSPLPAAITNEDTPNLQRAIFMVPFLIVLMAYGMYQMGEISKKWKVVYLGCWALYGLNFIYFSHMYLIHQKMSLASYFRNGGAAELVEELGKVGSKYTQIYLSNSPDGLEPWVNFLGGMRSNYVFSNEKCPSKKYAGSDLKSNNQILFVDAEGCTTTELEYRNYVVKEVKIIRRPDGSPPYYWRQLEDKL